MLLSLAVTFSYLQEFPRCFFPTGFSGIGKVLHLSLNGFEMESRDMYLTYELYQVKVGKKNNTCYDDMAYTF